jgi:hypothetical protein
MVRIRFETVVVFSTIPVETLEPRDLPNVISMEARERGGEILDR